MRVTIACPAALIAEANQLALCLGLGPEDAHTYGDPVWQDATGNRYAVASAIVSPRFAADASSPLTEPPWGADMAAAARAQVKIRLGEVARPDRLACVIGGEPVAAIALLGVFLVRAEHE